ncbi:DUF2069 domain-containing protein [Haliea sp. E17]|uniref:DUF2069 domain-containing protein n=1 Tax=Haliea sp. E17 TaxID=3401576 RepID=UPI003AAD7EE6
MSSRTRLARLSCFAAFILLCLQQFLDMVAAGAPWIIWLAVLLPLLILVPGILRDRPRSFIWLCFVSLLYFMRLVVDLFANPSSALYWTGMLAVVVLFCAAMLYVRWRARDLRDLAPATVKENI